MILASWLFNEVNPSDNRGCEVRGRTAVTASSGRPAADSPKVQRTPNEFIPGIAIHTESYAYNYETEHALNTRKILGLSTSHKQNTMLLKIVTLSLNIRLYGLPV